MNIHPTAIVDPSAKIAEDVIIGPFCVIESDTVIESGCEIAARVSIKSGVYMGANCKVFENAVIGGIGQHVCPPGPPGKVRIGSNNTFREFCTVHRSIKEDGFTEIGDGNYFMANAHIAHDCVIGNNNIVANNVMFGGHVHVGNRAFVSGGVAVHQFCSIGSYAMVGGQSHITKDVPPFVTVDGLTSRVVGINRVGLRRSGFTSAQIARFKDAYNVVYRQGLSWKETLETLRTQFNQGEEALLYEMLSVSTRGIVQARTQPSLKVNMGELEQESSDDSAAA
ncbi:MAG: acyl-ACP--UDP-N-acetylglucosamine O-acyltransferase [Thermoguttaceae bacterium]|nr:acyl-ACP--UDP-N-acetylglucosamine O-acyltransferase [Thermoguttaceae bacterium]